MGKQTVKRIDNTHIEISSIEETMRVCTLGELKQDRARLDGERTHFRDRHARIINRLDEKIAQNDALIKQAEAMGIQ